jgi:hypothetical protein
VKTCDDVGITDMALTVLGTARTTCYHLTQLNRPDVQERIAGVVDHYAENPPVPPAPRPCDSASSEILEAAHPLPPGMAYLKLDCVDRYLLARANTVPATTDNLLLTFVFRGGWHWTGEEGTQLDCTDIPSKVWQQWDVYCDHEPVSCGTVTTANGAPALVAILAGDVRCEEALDVAMRYYRDVPRLGTGSGGFLKVGNWDCMSATAGPGQDGVFGQCERTPDLLQMSRP